MSDLAVTSVVVIMVGVFAWWVRFSVRRRALDRWSQRYDVSTAKGLLREADRDKPAGWLKQLSLLLGRLRPPGGG